MNLASALKSLLRRRLAVETPPDPPAHASWLWSDLRRVAHRPSCPRIVNIRRSNLRGSSYFDEVRGTCVDFCRVCNSQLDLPTEESTAVESVNIPSTALSVAIPRPKDTIAGPPWSR